MAREVQVTFDCADPGALATFWRELSPAGWQLEQIPFSRLARASG